MRFPILALAVLSAGFGWPHRIAAQSCGKGAWYVTVDGEDTLAIEHVSFIDSAFTDQVQLIDQGGRMRFQGRITPEGLVRDLNLDIWATGDSSRLPDQHATVSFAADAITAIVNDAEKGRQLQLDSVRSWTLPYMDNIVLFLELLDRRATYLRSDSVGLPVAWLFTAGRHDVASVVRRGRTSARIEFADFLADVRRNASGDILSITRRGGAVTRRVPC